MFVVGKAKGVSAQNFIANIADQFFKKINLKNIDFKKVYENSY
jgi:hypothetical protein